MGALEILMIHPAQKYKISVSYNNQNMFKTSKIYLKHYICQVEAYFSQGK